MGGPERSESLEQLLSRRRELDERSFQAPALAQRLGALRAWQAVRLARTYEDLRRDPRYAAAVEFFLSDVYGPQDFTRRNSELTRALRPLRQTLPAALLEVLAKSIELDVLTVELDHAMIARLPEGPLTDISYATAYRAVGEAAARQRQIDLTVGIGRDLERLVRHRWIGLALRAARIPASGAGFAVLQGFLERGFAAFQRMGSAQPLLQAIRERETRLMEALLRGDSSVGNLLSPQPAVHA